MRRPAAVADLLSAFLRGTPAEERIKEGGIWLIWEDAVGSRIASHAQPVAFRDGVLTVAVDSSPWLQQLNFLKRDLIAKVNEKIGSEMVQSINLKAGKIAAPEKPVKSGSARRRQLSEEERAWIVEQAESVADPELRAVFESLIRKDRENR